MSTTETISPRYQGLDTWNDRDILSALWQGQLAAVAAVGPALGALEQAAVAVVAQLRQGGRLIYVGAGAAGHLAIQDGLELPQTFGWPETRLALLLAGGEQALGQSLGGAEDDAEAALGALGQLGLAAGDVVIGVAASGTTPYTVAALGQARAVGALAVAIANNPDTPLLHQAHHPILLATGAEVLAGSTRMNAGTAQKVALNLLSTLVMTRLGHVHDGFMVDMVIDNAKLRERGVAMLMRIAGVDQGTARATLAACGDRIKPAVLVARGLAPTAAEQLLDACGGSLRGALDRLPE